MKSARLPVLLAPRGIAPARVIPLSGKKSKELLVFGGYPDTEQPWLNTVLHLNEQKASASVLSFIQEVGGLEAGAPYGGYADESQRVSRATGLVVDAQGVVEGLLLTQGRAWAFWLDDVLVIEFQSPHSAGFGPARSRYAENYLSAACLQQMIGHSESIFEHLDSPERAKRIEVSFSGTWDEGTAKVRELIKKRVRMCRAKLPG